MVTATVWSKNSCPYCKLAVEELTKRGYALHIKYIGDKYTKEDLLKEVPDARTVPQIFIEDVHIGGYTELMKYFTSDPKI
jgi:glutaredoxin